jgi:hypothetical protein
VTLKGPARSRGFPAGQRSRLPGVRVKRAIDSKQQALKQKVIAKADEEDPSRICFPRASRGSILGSINSRTGAKSLI